MFKCDQCSYSSSRNKNLKRHERLKHYLVQNGKGVEKDTEEDTDSVKSDDTDVENLESVVENSNINKVSPEE